MLINKHKNINLHARNYVGRSFNCSGEATLNSKLDKNDETTEKIRTFSGTAYSGGIMVASWGVPVVIDLSGLKVSKKQRPMLKDHNPAIVVGHSTNFSVGDTITVDGILSGSNSDTTEIATASDNGFVWQMSVGIIASQVRFIKKDEIVKVNGRLFKNMEFYLIEKAVLKEVSFVALGADDNTSAMVANNNNNFEETPMNFLEWLNAKGFDDESKLTATMKASLQAMFDAELNASTSPAKIEDTKEENAIDPVKAMKASAIAESKRLVKIKSLCKGDEALFAKAVENDWDETKCELEVLRASSLKKVPNFIIDKGIDATDKQVILEASISKSIGRNVEKEFDAKTLDASHKHFRNLGLQELVVEVAKSNGYTGRESFNSNAREIMKFAFGKMDSAFSTISLPLILSNVMNKSLAKGFDSVEQAWRDVSDISSVSDFKTVVRYALTGDMEFEPITANGEIPQGKVGEIGYSNKASSYGKMFAITREMLINDDLNALSKVPMKIGRGGALKLNTVFWTKFLANTGVFSVGNKNLTTGAGSPLSITALTALITKLKKQTDPDGKTFPVKPARLLVPVELGVLAGQIVSDMFVLLDGATALTPAIQSNKNPHAGKFALTESAYLSDTTLAGNSATAFYLLANPSDTPVIETVFLNGVQAPNVESADADFDTLGIQMRGFFDFGVEFQEYRGGARSNGV